MVAWICGTWKLPELSGYLDNDVLGRSLLDYLCVPSDRQPLSDVLQSAFQGKSTSTFKLKFQSKAGEPLCWLVNVSPRRNGPLPTTPVNGAIVFAHDVSEATHRDRAVAALAREFRQFIDTANTPIFGVDGEGLINEWNEKMVEITGCTQDETFSKRFVDTFASLTISRIGADRDMQRIEGSRVDELRS